MRIPAAPYVVTIRDADEWRNFEPSIRLRKVDSISRQDSLGPLVRMGSIEDATVPSGFFSKTEGEQRAIGSSRTGMGL